MPGQRGAPLRDDEIEEIEKAYVVVKKYLSLMHRDVIEERGFVQGRKGDYTTQVVNRKACVFSIFENGVAKCSFEKAYLNNEISWQKPISCHLFPIRTSPGFPEQLRYEEIAECKSAVERGAKEKVLLIEFLKSSLVRAYGEEWYREFTLYCQAKSEEVPEQGNMMRSSKA